MKRGTLSHCVVRGEPQATRAGPRAVLPGRPSRAGGRLVLVRNADPLQSGGLAVGCECSSFTFDEATDPIVPLDTLGVELDRSQWDLTWPTSEQGRALEPGASAADNDRPAAWCLASAPVDPLSLLDLGTPGSTNPSCSCMVQEDLPDAGVVDARCDGIDGERRGGLDGDLVSRSPAATGR